MASDQSQNFSRYRLPRAGSLFGAPSAIGSSGSSIASSPRPTMIRALLEPTDKQGVDPPITRADLCGHPLGTYYSTGHRG
jgi:hypothetical protein